MRILSDDDQEKIRRALELANIYILEHPNDDAPSQKVHAALDIMSKDSPACCGRIEELEGTLRDVLKEISDTSGALLRPSPALVEKIKSTLAGNIY